MENIHSSRNLNLPVSVLYNDSRPILSFKTNSPNGYLSLPKLDFLSTIDQSQVTIHHSCNGLTLCTRGSDLIVCNLTTQNFKVIPYDPPPYEPFPRLYPDNCLYDDKFISFNPTKSPYYKVVVLLTIAVDSDFGVYYFDIYTSKSRTWDRISFFSESFCATKKVLFDGSIYWINNESMLEKCNIDEVTSKIVPLRSQPLIFCGEYRIVWLGEFNGRLFLVQAISSSTENRLRVPEMNTHTFRWTIKFTIDLELAINLLPAELNTRDLSTVQVLCLKEWNVYGKSFPSLVIVLIFAIKGKIISYNPNGNRVELLDGVLGDACETNMRVHKYIESVATV